MSSEAGSSPTTGPEDARGRVACSGGHVRAPRPAGTGPEAARAFLAQAGDAGIDHVCCGDHLSFAGAGFDALAMLHPRRLSTAACTSCHCAIPSSWPASSRT
jgi:hypothetical protein